MSTHVSCLPQGWGNSIGTVELSVGEAHIVEAKRICTRNSKAKLGQMLWNVHTQWLPSYWYGRSTSNLLYNEVDAGKAEAYYRE